MTENSELKPVLPTFTPRKKVWWKVKGEAYGYRQRIPCELIEMSRSGKRAFVTFQYHNATGRVETMRTYIDVKNLEPREELPPV